MKKNVSLRRSGLTRLAAVNPVPSSERDSLIARLAEIRPQLPAVEAPDLSGRWKAPMVALAAVLVLTVGGVAVAASWNPLAGIGSADRAARPDDTVSEAVKEQLRAHESSWPGGVSQLGTRLVDEARLLGRLPDGRNVYAVPTSTGKLCLLEAVATRISGEACYPPLTRAAPITWLMAKARPSAPLVIWGAAADGVVSVSFNVAGEPVTVPVEDNFYVWQGQPTATRDSVSPATVSFTDGTTAPAG